MPNFRGFIQVLNGQDKPCQFALLKAQSSPRKRVFSIAVFWVNVFLAELSHPLIAALGISVFIQMNKRPPDKHQRCPAGFLSPMGNFLSQSLVIVLCSCCSVEGASSCEPTVCTQLMTQKAEKVHITGVGRGGGLQGLHFKFALFFVNYLGKNT